MPEKNLTVPSRRLLRRVGSDSLVDVDTSRYSVWHRLVKQRVEVLVTTDEVVIFHGTEEVARHRRTYEPRQKVINPRHYDGLWRPWETAAAETKLEDAFPGRSLAAYEAIVTEGSL